MLRAISQFRDNIKRVHHLGGLYKAIKGLTTSAVDPTDILRAQIVLSVSALDQYVHELTVIGLLEVYNGIRPQTNAYLSFQVSLGSTMSALASGGDAWLENAIREKHSYLTFQQPDKITNAIKLFSKCKLWNEVASIMGTSVEDVKTQLRLIIERRNKIAHEADIDPSFPGSLWPITEVDSTNVVIFVDRLCEAIHLIV